jgi:8-oxo-dGTP pyrophosphatase MutT (NUDIX family)
MQKEKNQENNTNENIEFIDLSFTSISSISSGHVPENFYQSFTLINQSADIQDHKSPQVNQDPESPIFNQQLQQQELQPQLQPQQLLPKKIVYCANCGGKGHVYKNCDGPITSFGIIAFKVVKTREEEMLDLNNKLRNVISQVYSQNNEQFAYTSLFSKEYPVIKFLMIQRKDTMGFIDFVRGKYPTANKDERDLMLKIYLNEMTTQERESLITKSFDELWDELWVNHESKCYKKEYESAKYKFLQLNISELMKDTYSKWSFQEFGFPKGRRNMRETNIACAEREFCEETGYQKAEYEFLKNYPTIEEEFVGTNGVSYKHIYYLVKMKDYVAPPIVDFSNKLQSGEVQNVGWFTFDQCIKLIRPYDGAKKYMLSKVYNDLLELQHRYICTDFYYKKKKKMY